MESGSKVATVVVSLVVGVVVGLAGGYAIGNGMDKGTDTKSNQSSMSESKDGGDGVTVGGAKMVRDKDIVDNAVNASNVTTLVSLVKQAELVETLKGEGPFTVFGPNNGAFDKIDKATVETLQKPEGKEMLTKILTYHVVPGTYTSAALKVMASKGETLTSVQGEVLTPVLDGGQLKIQDAKGNKVAIETADVISSNGVTHVIDSVLMP